MAVQFKISDELIIATLSGIDASSLVLYGLSVKKRKKFNRSEYDSNM